MILLCFFVNSFAWIKQILFVSSITMEGKVCTFCSNCFRCLGKHLKSCSQRNGRPYDEFLASRRGKTVRNSTDLMRTCSVCGKCFKRLDVHLRWNKECRDPFTFQSRADKSFSGDNPQLHQHSEISVNVTPFSPATATNSPSSTPIHHNNTTTIKPPLKLPNPSDLEEWTKADEYIRTCILPAVINESDVNTKADLFASLVYGYFETQYGTGAEYHDRTCKRKRKHQRQLKSIRQQKNEIRRAYRSALRSNQPRNIILPLVNEYHRLVRLHSKICRQHAQADLIQRMKFEQRRCSRNIWKYSNSLFDSNDSNHIDPSFTKDQAQAYFETVYSNVTEVPFSNAPWMTYRTAPSNPFNSDPISLDEIKHRIKKCRNGSAPCPLDQINYVILKKCPSTSIVLRNIFNACIISSCFPASWQRGIIKLIGKPTASSDSSNPANFRPIALTPCIGKVFTSILKHRLLHYASCNKYLDLSIQKAFVDTLPGCIEHHCKLSGALNEAKNQQKNICICWIDLANAYGSVHHQLIFLVLQHYHLPDAFINLVKNIYCGLSAIVSSRQWSTAPFSLKIGIFQGDPMSVIIFNLVINLFVEFITEHYHQLGYHFAGSHHILSLLQYADDSCMVANSEENCQLMCNATEKWLCWANMSAKVSKCRILALRRGKLVPSPSISLNGSVIPPVESNSIKFLGLPISNTLSDNDHRLAIQNKLQSMLSSVDAALIRRKQKLKVFTIGICPRLAWMLMIILIPISWVERHLDSLSHSYLKKWAGLARCASTDILHLRRSEGGLGLPLLSSTFKKLQVSRVAQLARSQDEVVRFLVNRMITDEASTYGRAFLPSSIINGILQDHPHVSKNQLKKCATFKVVSQDENSQLRHIQSLEVQGECYRLGKDKCQDIWSRAVNDLPDVIFKFALNATLDTLPHFKNLKKWGKSATDECPLCHKSQSLIHVLNACQVSLNYHRFTVRHDMVLSEIALFIKVNAPKWNMTADLPSTNYVRPHFLVSDLRPDIVIWSDIPKKVYLLELTVCFDTSFDEAIQRKTDRYLELADVINQSGYNCSVITLQVGSRGFIDTDAFEDLRKILNVKIQVFVAFLKRLSSISIKESFKIWSARNTVIPP